MPESGNPSLPPPTGSYYLWLSTDGFFKKMDSAGNVSNLSAQSIEDLNDVDLTGLQDGQGIAWNALDQKWEPVTFPEGGGVDTFVELTDTPSQYTGMAGKVATVNQAENALEFTDKLPADGFVESVNGETGVVVLDPDDLDDSATTHKFASQAQLDQIATNATNISTNAGDISSLESDVGNLETQVNINTGNISTNTTNIATNTGNIATNTSDIADLQSQLDGGAGKTYTGVEAIEVNNTDDQISLKLTEDSSGQFDTMTVSGFNSDFNHSFEVVKRDGERVNIDLDLQGQNIVLNYDSGTHQLYRCLIHDDMFIGYCDEIGYWIAVKLTVSHNFDVELNGSAALGLQSWVQLGTLSTLLGNGNYIPSSSYLSYSGFAINDSYLNQSANGLTVNVSSGIDSAQAYQVADALDVKQGLDAKLNDTSSGLDSNRDYVLQRSNFNGFYTDSWVKKSDLLNTNAPVQSVHGRTGDIVSANGDYSSTQITETTSKQFISQSDKAQIGVNTTNINTNAGNIASAQSAITTLDETKLDDTSDGLDTVNRDYFLQRSLFSNDVTVDAWVRADSLGGDDAKWTADPVKIGQDAGLTSQASQAVAIGYEAGQDTQSTLGIAIGYQAGQITQNEGAVAIGTAAGQTNQGAGAFAFGQSAGNSNQADYAMAIGTNAGQITQGTRSVALGYNAGNDTQSNNCVAVGNEAGKTTQGAYAVAFGDRAGSTNQGTLALAYGYKAGETNQGAYSVAIGSRASSNTQPESSICINGSNSFLNNTASKQIKIGQSDYAVQIGDGNVSAVSDARDKYDIQDIPLGLDFVNALQPKFYKYDIRELYEESDEEGVVTKHAPDGSKAGVRFHSGFIAQDVKAAMDSFGVDFGVYRDEAVKAEEVHRERATGKLSLCYREFIAIQTKAIQELSSKVSSLEAEIAILKGA